MGEKNKKSEENGGCAKNNVTVLLKADLHCEGCVIKVLKCIRSFHGVDSASIAGEQKITVVGKVDPMKLRDKVEAKTHKKIEIISPQPKKDNNSKENAKGKENASGDKAKPENTRDSNDKDTKDSNDKNAKNKSDKKQSTEKEKQIPVTTAVLKVNLHCEGCIQKMSKIVAKTKGYQDMKIDKEKELVTVTGTMDMAALAEQLKKNLKKDVEILPPKKEKNEGGDKQKNDKADKGKNKSAGEKGKAAATAAGGGGGGGGEKVVEANKVEFQVVHPYPYAYGDQQFYYYNGGGYHAPQLFSDENPNACSIM